MNNTVTRFAPSPTGNLHIGGIRTALINFIVTEQAKKKYPNSKCILFFSKKPKKNSSSYKMLKKYVEHGYVDDLVYIIPSDNKTSSLENFI